MTSMLTGIGWELFKALLSVAGVLLVFAFKNEISRRQKLEERIKRLEEWKVVSVARAKAWREFGSPERRGVFSPLELAPEEGQDEKGES